MRSALDAYKRAVRNWTRQQRQKETGFGLLSQFHGSVYEYFRNNALDAIPHEVRQAGGTASALHRNQWGFTFNGPLPIGPASRRKAHLAVTFERTREAIDHAFLGTVPSLRERGGDFSDLVDSSGNSVPIFDPATTRPNPAYDPAQPVSLANLQYLRDRFAGNQIPASRLDPVAMKLVNMYPAPNANVGPFLTNNFFANEPQANNADGVIVTLDYDFSPSHHLTLRGANSVGLHRQPSVFGNDASPGRTSQAFADRSGSLSDTWNVTGNLVNQVNLDWSDERQTSLNPAGADWPRSLGLGGIHSNVFPHVQLDGAFEPLGRNDPIQDNDNHQLNLGEHVSLRAGRHNVGVGIRFQQATLNSFEAGAPAGNFAFSGLQTSLPGINNTGSPLAQMLLGDVSQMHSTLVPYPMSYEYHRVRLDLQDRVPLWSGFDWTLGLTIRHYGPRHERYHRISSLDPTLENPATGGLGAMVFGGSPQRSRAVFEPHVGFALNPFSGGTVIRANYDLNYQNYRLPGEGFGSLGYTLQPQYTSPNDQLTPAFRLRDGVPQIYPAPPDLSPTVANGQHAQFIAASGLLPMNQNWQFQIEQTLSSSLTLQLSYNGELATHQYTGSIDLNALPPSALRYGNRLYDQAFNQSLRPYPQYTGIDTGGNYPWGTSTYNGFNVDLQDRFTAGLMFEASYTFSKSLNNYGYGRPQNSANLAAEKSLDPFSRSQRLNFNFLYELPVGRDGRWLNASPALNWLLSDWNLSGFVSFSNGHPLMLQPMFNNTGGVADSLRVNVVPGISPLVSHPTAEGWFNPAAFAQPPDFTFGNASRTSPVLRGPGQRSADLSLSRDVALAETRTLQIFIEGFNAFNHANLNDPDTVIGPASSPNLHAGKITGSWGGRVVQLGLRLEF